MSLVETPHVSTGPVVDHLSLRVADMARSAAFYDSALAPLGLGRVMVMDGTEAPFEAVGYGPTGKPVFWIGKPSGEVPPLDGFTGFHIAFAAPDRATVDAFYAAAMAAGGADNGAPGLRPHYHEHYYAAFVIDPDGYHVEAVCHRPA